MFWNAGVGMNEWMNEWHIALQSELTNVADSFIPVMEIHDKVQVLVCIPVIYNMHTIYAYNCTRTRPKLLLCPRRVTCRMHTGVQNNPSTMNGHVGLSWMLTDWLCLPAVVVLYSGVLRVPCTECWVAGATRGRFIILYVIPEYMYLVYHTCMQPSMHKYCTYIASSVRACMSYDPICIQFKSRVRSIYYLWYMIVFHIGAAPSSASNITVSSHTSCHGGLAIGSL